MEKESDLQMLNPQTCGHDIYQNEIFNIYFGVEDYWQMELLTEYKELLK